MEQHFDLNGNEVNEVAECQYHTKHLTREIISRFFEKEKVLRSLSGEERDKYENEYVKEIMEYIPLLDDNSPFEENGKWGVRNNVLDIVMLTPQYDEVSDLCNDGGKDYYFCKVRSGNKYGLVVADKNGGTIVSPPINDDIMLLEDYLGEYVGLIAMVIKRDNKYGLSYGYEIDLEPIYDKITLACKENIDYILLEKDGKYGLLNESKLIPAEYDEIQVPSLMGWIKARKGNVWGYFDVDGHFTEDISKAFMLRIKSIWSLKGDMPTCLNGLFDDYSSLLETVFPLLSPQEQEEVECIGNQEDDRIFYKRILYKDYATMSEKTGLRLAITAMDLIPPRYDELQYISGDLYCYKLRGKYGLVMADGKGTELCPPLYDEVKKTDTLYYGVLVRIKQKWGIATDSYPTELDYDEIIEKDRSYGNQLLIKKDGKWGTYINGNIIPPVYDGIFVPEVFGWVRVCKDGEWGYLDINNEFTSDVSKAFLCLD